MPISYPIPQEAQGLYDRFSQYITGGLGNLLDPHQGGLPPAFPGYEAQRPTGLPQMIAGALMPGGLREAYQSGIMSAGMMPLQTGFGTNWAKRAKSMFGTTEDYASAGWILPNGDMLKHHVSHDMVEMAAPKPIVSGDTNLRFMNEANAIRIGGIGRENQQSPVLFLQLTKKPTQPQINKIEDAVYGHNIDFVYGDIMSSDGKIMDSLRIVDKPPKEIMRFLHNKIKGLPE